MRWLVGILFFSYLANFAYATVRIFDVRVGNMPVDAYIWQWLQTLVEKIF